MRATNADDFEKILDLSLLLHEILLEDFGYPKEALAGKAIKDEHFIPDVSIIEPQVGRPLAFFHYELALGDINDNLSTKFRNFLERQNLEVPVFCLTAANSRNRPEDLRIFELTNNGWKAIQTKSLPQYKNLLTVPKQSRNYFAPLRSVGGFVWRIIEFVALGLLLAYLSKLIGLT